MPIEETSREFSFVAVYGSQSPHVFDEAVLDCIEFDQMIDISPSSSSSSPSSISL
jgi:hypothetical protein